MKTPNTIEGAITEDIMRRAVQKLGQFPTHNYNRFYEAVLESLNANLPAARQAPPDMDGEGFARIQIITEDLAYWKRVGYWPDQSNEEWWCEVHRRPAKWWHQNPKADPKLNPPRRMCDPHLGGITMPCRVVKGHL